MSSFTVLSLYAGSDWGKKVPWPKKYIYYRDAYEHWNRFARERDIRMVRSSIKWYDSKEKMFAKAWEFDGKTTWKKISNVRPHIVFDRTSAERAKELYNAKIRLASAFPMLNNPSFSTLVGDKANQIMLFGEHMPKSYVAFFAHDVVRMLKGWRGTVVAKPLAGSGGFGVVITTPAKLAAQAKELVYPVVIQQFVDAGGIKGISDTLADLRMVFVDHEFCYAATRIAKEGSLMTNVHQGATTHVVAKNQIPESAFVLAKKLQKRLRPLGSATYSLDFLFTKEQKPVFIEANTSPGIYFDPADREYQEKFFGATLDLAQKILAT